MGFCEKLRNTWISMSTNRKIKAVFSILCDIGGGILASKMCSYYVKDEPKIIRNIVGITGFGLGSAISQVAYDEFCETINLFVPEEKKNEEEESDA